MKSTIMRRLAAALGFFDDALPARVSAELRQVEQRLGEARERGVRAPDADYEALGTLLTIVRVAGHWEKKRAETGNGK